MAMIVNGLLSLRAGILKYDTANKSNVFDQSGALVHTLTLATDQGNELGGNKPDAEATAKAAADERKWKMMQQQLDEAAEVAAKKEAEKKVEEEQRVGSRACESPPSALCLPLLTPSHMQCGVACIHPSCFRTSLRDPCV